MPRLIHLPVEILHGICSQLCLHCSGSGIACADPEPFAKRGSAKRSDELRHLRHPIYNLAALCKTSRLLHDIAKPYLYHCIKWSPDATNPRPFLRLAEQLITNSKLAGLVGAIEIDCIELGPISPTSDFTMLINSEIRRHTDNRFNIYLHQWFEVKVDKIVLQTVLMNTPAVRELKLNLLRGVAPSPLPLSNRVFLPALRKLHIDAAGSNRGGWRPDVEPFLKISHNLTTLSLAHIDHIGNDSIERMQNIVELTLDSCKLSKSSLASLIGTCTHLEAFRMYRPSQAFPKDSEAVYSHQLVCPASTVAALEKHKKTLRSLCLYMEVRPHCHRTGLDTKDVDFHEFESLENLCVRLHDLRCSESDAADELCFDTLDNLKATNDPSDPRCQDGYLASILPNSIRKIYLVDELHPREGVAIVSANLWGLDTALESFPNLEEVSIPGIIWAQTMSNRSLVAKGAKPDLAAAERLRKLGRTWAQRGGPKLIDTPPVGDLLETWL
ncbi:hypothetical protein B0T14DRAFT_314705 [Immersiella caudata]|uniref:F-box domain-containing protein n=1 Tax=Immersiella caudata TaxID=314043 RepID=A0AA39W9Z2_9PEZI|nr:hypothetical protein B0T14DRAFT_314705 [Immersiella caudata]